MVGLRRGHCYSCVKRGKVEGLERAYTRKSKFKTKAFIKSVPTNKLTKYHMGDINAKFKYRINLVALSPVQIRHNALESARLITNRRLEVHLGNSNYHFIVRVYPHHVLRENKMITGAGADRMQTGMQLAYGASIGLAAQVKKMQSVFSIDVNRENIEFAKQCLKLSTPRMSGRFTITEEVLNQ